MGALCEVCGHDMEEAASCVEMSVETVDGRLAPIRYGAEAEDWGAYPALPAMTGGPADFVRLRNQIRRDVTLSGVCHVRAPVVGNVTRVTAGSVNGRA